MLTKFCFNALTLNASTLTTPFAAQIYRLHNRKFSTTGENKTPSDQNEHRGEQSKGATIAFFRGLSSSEGKSKIWSKLKDNIRAADPNAANIKPSVEDNTGEVSRQDSSSDFRKFPRIVNLKSFSKSPSRTWTPSNTADGVAPPPSFGKGRRNRGGDGGMDDKDDDGDWQDEQIPQAIQNMLFDHEQLQNLLEEPGKRIADVGLDYGDKFIANIVTQALKTSDGVYRDVQVSKSFRTVKLPVARPARHLLMTTIPDIPDDPSSRGYELGSVAWHVLSKNYYYSEADCKYMSQSISRLANRYLAQIEKIDHATVDMVLDADFRKGLTGIELETRKLESIEDAKPAKQYLMGATDWTQDAVVDEDEL